MSWRLALGADEDSLQALAGARAIVSVAEADVVVWPARREAAPAGGAALHVVDLRGVEPTEAVSLAGAGLLLVGSAAAFGAWRARAAAVPIGVVPAAAAAADAPGERVAALHLLLSEDREADAAAAAAWAAARGIACGVAEGPLASVARWGAAPAVASGAVAVDLRASGVEASPALLRLLAAGAPVLWAEETPLRVALAAAGAGWRFEAVDAGLEQAAAAYRQASAAALGFVRARFGAAGAAAAFERAVSGALSRQRARAAAWERLGPGGHVLVVSDEGPNLRHLRVHQPFDALVRRGAIAGYSVLWRGQWAFSAPEAGPETRFSAIFVQRSVDPAVRLLLRTLGRPFVYDLDDDLLVSPGYRPAFEAGGIETAAGLVAACTVLSCATPALARLAPEKAVVTPNLLWGERRRRVGAARTVVWASSDAPALTSSRGEIERAVRDFCRAHGLTLLCLGAPPPALFAAAGLAVEAAGLLPYPLYLERLRAAAPGILVGPLETQGDPATQRFVDAKSDIKVIEAGSTGLVGVFSRARPYADSDLSPDVLCPNDYAGWIDGLTRAKALCETAETLRAWPVRRDGAGAGPMPWAEALGRVRTDLPAAELQAALRFVARQGETLLSTPALFDEADYLRRHGDVAAAVAAGVVPSGYRHFVQSGFREGRAAQRVPSAPGESAFWWTRLLHEVEALELSVRARDGAIAGLRERLATRRALPAAAPAVPAADGLRWGGREEIALPCPVCAAAGPHGALVTDGAATLLRCDGCGTCFYADRAAHDYETTAAGPLLEQFTLEQNASIHHQTRLLFGRAGARSVLDVGCGFGFAVDMAAGLGWRAVGIDPSWAGEIGRVLLGADIRTGYLDADTETGEPFDLVIASEVIEHVPDPYALLRLLRDRLAPGGVLALTTPHAGAIAPGVDRGRLLGILAPGVHLTLFSERSLGLALRQAGFADVSVRVDGDTLIAEASDWPLRESAAGAHGAAYRGYLERLVERAEPGGALWNGAAGRLLAVLAPVGHGAALFERMAAAWRARWGFDLAAPALPDALDEAAIRTIGAAALGRRQPFNLAPVLLCRALMAADPAERLRWAAPAYRVAVETRRVLQAENLVDLDLKQTAWRSRLLMLEALAAEVPALAGTLLQAAGAAGAGAQGDWDDAPAAALTGLVAPFFAEAVAAGRFGEARRVAAWVADADQVVAALAAQPELLLRTLLGRGRLAAADGDPARAAGAFERLAAEARRLCLRPWEAIAAEALRSVEVRDRPSP